MLFNVHLATAARVKDPAACCAGNLMPRQLAAGSLTEQTDNGVYMIFKETYAFIENVITAGKLVEQKRLKPEMGRR